ncbi:MAG: flagellar protein FliT [Meiothermus sp.]
MIRLNLLPKNLRRRVEPGWWRLAAILFVVAVLGIVGYLHYSAWSQLQALQDERDQLRLEVDVLRPAIREQQDLLRRQKELQPLEQVRQQLENRRVRWSENIAAFVNQIPRENGRFGVALRSIGASLRNQPAAPSENLYDGKPVKVEFNLQGEALGQAQLVRFVEAFESSPRFGINFQQATLDQNRGLYTFSATVGMVEEPQGGEQGAR